MRYFFAIASLVIAGVLLILGVGQRTFLAGPKTIEHAVELSSDSAEYVVIPASIFTEVTGNPSVILTGQEVFVAIGHQRDVDAWVAPFDHEVAEFDAAELSVATNTVAAVRPEPQPVPEDDATAEQAEPEGEGGSTAEEQIEPELLDPRGSDLWVSESNGETSLKVALSLEPSQALLVTSGVEEIAHPSTVTLMWAQPRNTPWAGPLLVGGAAFGILGAVLYLIALDHDRKGIGPRRGRKGPFQGLRNKRKKMRVSKAGAPTTESRRGTKLGFSVLAVTVASLTLTSCSPSYWPQPQMSVPIETPELPDEKLAVIPVLDSQLDQIVEYIIESINEADAELDASLLESRLGGAALAQRKANYTISKVETGWRELPHLTGERLSYDLVQSTEKWPRTIFVTVNSTAALASDEATEEAPEGESATTEGESAEIADAQPEEASPTLALLLTQQSAHENYKLKSIIELRGGIQMPEAAPAAEGTAVLAEDIKTLQLSPREAVEALASVMQTGTESEEAALFDLDEEMLVEKMGAAWAKNQCVEGLVCEAQVVVSEEPIVTLSTGQSGALVVATILDRHTMEVSSDRNVVKLSNVEKALGLEGSYQRVVREWQHQVLLYVPGKDSNSQIQILGSSSEIVRATGKKTE